MLKPFAAKREVRGLTPQSRDNLRQGTKTVWKHAKTKQHDAATRIQNRYRSYRSKLKSLIPSRKGDRSLSKASHSAGGSSRRARMKERAAAIGTTIISVAALSTHNVIAAKEAVHTRLVDLKVDETAKSPSNSKDYPWLHKVSRAQSSKEDKFLKRYPYTAPGSNVVDSKIPSRMCNSCTDLISCKEANALDLAHKESSVDDEGGSFECISETTQCTVAAVDGNDVDLQRCKDIIAQNKSELLNILCPKWKSEVNAEANLGPSVFVFNKWMYSSSSLFRRMMCDVYFVQKKGVSCDLRGQPPVPSSAVLSQILDQFQHLRDEEVEQVKKIFRNLRSELMMPAVRLFGWLLCKAFERLFNGLHIDMESVEKLKQTLESNKGKEIGLVLLPTHKSHLDYLIISFVCFAHGLPTPRIAAGVNLNLPIIGSFLRANGSFFIRRTFKGDAMYKSVLSTYVQALLKQGWPVELFIEGGRSRHGRVCEPKLGLLSMIVQNQNDRMLHDTLLVPISVDYDHVLEVNEYSRQLTGEAKKPESLFALLRSTWEFFFKRCGFVYVKFGSCMSVENELEKRHVARDDPTALKSAVKDIGQEVAYAMQSCATIPLSSLVASCMSSFHSRLNDVLSIRQLKKYTLTLSQHIVDRGFRVGLMTGFDDQIGDVLREFGEIVSFELHPHVFRLHLNEPMNALHLSFYRNQLLHVFLPEACALVGLQVAFKGKRLGDRVSVDTAIRNASILMQYMKNICQHRDVDLSAFLREKLNSEWHGYVLSNDDSIERVYECTSEDFFPSFLCDLVLPFVDSLWIVCQALHVFEPTKFAEKDLIQYCLSFGNTLTIDGQIHYVEACNVASIRQGIRFCTKLLQTENGSVSMDEVEALCSQLHEHLSICGSEDLDTPRQLLGV